MVRPSTDHRRGFRCRRRRRDHLPDRHVCPPPRRPAMDRCNCRLPLRRLPARRHLQPIDHAQQRERIRRHLVRLDRVPHRTVRRPPAPPRHRRRRIICRFHDPRLRRVAAHRRRRRSVFCRAFSIADNSGDFSRRLRPAHRPGRDPQHPGRRPVCVADHPRRIQPVHGQPPRGHRVSAAREKLSYDRAVDAGGRPRVRRTANRRHLIQGGEFGLVERTSENVLARATV